MSKPNLLFYANKLGGREIGLIFLCSFVGRTRFFCSFCRIFRDEYKRGCNMNLKMKYIILYVEKFEECLRFYKDTLQLPIKAEHGTYIEFNTGSTILAMNTREDVKELTGLPLTEGELQSSHFELGFVVENVQETIEQFREQGIKVLVEPIVKPWGQTIAYIADPDGNYIEICSSLE